MAARDKINIKNPMLLSSFRHRKHANKIKILNLSIKSDDLTAIRNSLITVSQVFIPNLSLKNRDKKSKPSARNAVMASISPFNILLNNLSNELSSVNLQSLINVCGDRISESERERISSGWDVLGLLMSSCYN